MAHAHALPKKRQSASCRGVAHRYNLYGVKRIKEDRMLQFGAGRGHKSAEDPATALYLELMKRCVTNSLYRDMADTTLGRDLRDEGRPWRRGYVAGWHEPM